MTASRGTGGLKEALCRSERLPSLHAASAYVTQPSDWFASVAREWDGVWDYERCSGAGSEEIAGRVVVPSTRSVEIRSSFGKRLPHDQQSPRPRHSRP